MKMFKIFIDNSVEYGKKYYRKDAEATFNNLEKTANYRNRRHRDFSNAKRIARR